MSDVYVVVVDSTNKAYEKLSDTEPASLVLLARELREDTAIRWAESLPDAALPPIHPDEP